MYGCAWHRDRGEHVCGNTLRVRREALEGRVGFRVDGLLEVVLETNPPPQEGWGGGLCGSGGAIQPGRTRLPRRGIPLNCAA
jgi:hypothetical protein